MPARAWRRRRSANVYQAIENDHEIVPVLNKVDLPAAEPERVKQQIEDVIGLDASDAVMISAKTGQGVPDVLEAIVQRLPAPRGNPDATLKAMLVDSWYDAYLGVVVLVRIIDGRLKKGQRVRMMGTGAIYDVDRVGVITPKLLTLDELGPGEIGFMTASIKEVADTRVGDTITDDKKPTAKMLPGFKPAQPVVFCGLFPVDCGRFRRSARRHGQAAPQRCKLLLRDGKLRGLGVRLPLRVPRPVAP
jgi:GTP-binding protein LepA